jgi:hypothetical protein
VSASNTWEVPQPWDPCSNVQPRISLLMRTSLLIAPRDVHCCSIDWPVLLTSHEVLARCSQLQQVRRTLLQGGWEGVRCQLHMHCFLPALGDCLPAVADVVSIGGQRAL